MQPKKILIKDKLISLILLSVHNEAKPSPKKSIPKIPFILFKFFILLLLVVTVKFYFFTTVQIYEHYLIKILPLLNFNIN